MCFCMMTMMNVNMEPEFTVAAVVVCMYLGVCVCVFKLCFYQLIVF